MDTTGEQSDIRGLIDRIRDGKGSFEELIKTYQKPVWNTVYRILNNYHNTEEVVQDTFVRIYAKLDLYNPKYPFISWIRKIAVNQAFQLLRNKKKSSGLISALFRAGSRSRTEPVPSHVDEKVAEIHTFLDTLKPSYRTAFSLYYFDNMPIDEISYTMGRKKEAVKSLIYRARDSIRQHLGEKGAAI